MKELLLEGSQSTPSVKTDWENGVLALRGDSYPENSFEFFAQIIDWVESFLRDSTAPLQLQLWLVYMNTSSIKAMMDILDLLEEAHGAGRAVGVNWYYDPRNERVMELAEEFKEDCTFPFEILADE